VPRLAKPIPTSPTPTSTQSGASFTLKDAVARWQVSLEAENRAPRTIAEHGCALGVVGGILGADVAVSDGPSARRS
jgi:hypothetical protein